MGDGLSDSDERREHLDYVEATDEEFTDFIARSSAFAFLDDDEPYSQSSVD